MGKAASALILAVVLLLALGIVVLASTSSVRGAASFDDPGYFLKRQAVWVAIALLAGVLLSRFDYHLWQRFAVPLTAVALLFLVMVLIPGIGTRIGGARRWIRMGPFSLQPSEFAKYAMIVAVAAWMTHVGRRAALLREGLLYPIGIVGAFAGLTILEPDFGTTLLTGVVGMAIMFAGGTRLSHLVVTGALGMSAFLVAIMQDDVRMGRVLAFLMPEKYPVTAYHLAQSKVAFIRGGLFGVGLGNSLQKQFYLPEAHTDFIFAIIGEELGLIVTLLVVVLYGVILYSGIWISMHAADAFGRLLGFGVTMMVSLQAAINIGVVTGCLPTKGLPLPLISYGGSSLLVSVACVATLLNIAHHGAAGGDTHTRIIRDHAHRF